MEVAPDFYSYFQATRPLLATDMKLWCVSAWNDNEKEVFIDTDDIGKIILPIFNRYGTCTCIVSFNECVYIMCVYVTVYVRVCVHACVCLCVSMCLCMCLCLCLCVWTSTLLQHGHSTFL